MATAESNLNEGSTNTAAAPLDRVAPPAKSESALARYLPTAARVLLGLDFFIFGLNGFLNFIPRPATPPPAAAMAFIGGLLGTGYFFPLLKGTEVIAGAALLANRFVPLALAVLAPIVLNIAFFHVVVAPTGAPVAIVTLVLEIYLAWVYRAAFQPMLATRVTPHRAPG